MINSIRFRQKLSGWGRGMKVKYFFWLFFLTSQCFTLTGENPPALKHNPWSLIIYRPENSGGMNDVRCWLRLEDAETGEDVTYVKARANYAWINRSKGGIPYERAYYLSGGMAMHLLIKPGKYKIGFYTPIDRQNDFYVENKKQWESNLFYYNTENPIKVLFVSPTSDENGFYNGGWFIDYKAPKYFKFTKPKRN